MPKPVLSPRASAGEDDGVLQGLKEDRASEEPPEIVEADEGACLSHARIAQAEPDGEEERIGDQEEQEEAGGSDERVSDRRLVHEEVGEGAGGRLAARGGLGHIPVERLEPDGAAPPGGRGRLSVGAIGHRCRTGRPSRLPWPAPRGFDLVRPGAGVKRAAFAL